MNPFVHNVAALDWSVASRPLPGESVSGDLHCVQNWEGGVLVAVVDGLGHGDEATQAARAAVAEIERRARDPLTVIVEACHRALRHTRGVVMSLVRIETRTGAAHALGIGNVEAVLVRAAPVGLPPRESVLLRGGVVGYQLPALQISELELKAGDLLLFATDGVREDFADGVSPREPLDALVDGILERKFRGHDDGLVLAARYTGEA